MSATLDEKIGLRFYEARKEVDWTQEAVAELLDIEQPAISRIENGDQKLTAAQAILLFYRIGLDINQISL